MISRLSGRISCNSEEEEAWVPNEKKHQQEREAIPRVGKFMTCCANCILKLGASVAISVGQCNCVKNQ